jgi:D-alanine transaminase
MPRIAYVNGRYVPHAEAAVHIEDRGYQFADGVYEVVPVFRGQMVDEELHLDRLERSLSELRIEMPMSRQALRMITAEVMRRNRLDNGFVYMQITRGVAPRDHKFPKHAKPAVVMSVRQTKLHGDAAIHDGVKVVTQPDLRWARRDIKSVSLLPNCLAKQNAHEAGASEAWLVEEDGTITEGTSTNAWILTEDNKLVTRKADSSILNGITRVSLIKCAEAEGIAFEERPFTPEEAYRAREAFLTSSSNFVMPVTEIDGRTIGNGHAGLLTLKLRQAYVDSVATPGKWSRD